MSVDILDRFCGSPFWEYDVSWNTDRPLLNNCFRQIIFSSVPCVVFLILTPIETWLSVKPKNHPPVVWSWIGYSRLVSAVVLGLLSIVELFVSQVEAHPRNSESCPSANGRVISLTLEIITFASICLTLMFYKRNGLPTSGSIWIFSVFFTFFSSINLYTALVENLKMFTDTEYVTTLIRLPFITWLLTSSSFADLPEEDEVTQRTKNDEGKETKRCFSNQRSPRVYASFPSIFTFSWVTPLTALGFKKSLKVEDLYSLRSDETSKEFAPLFIKTFNDQKSKKSGPGVLKTMFSTLGWDLFLGNFMMLLSEIAQVSPPMLLKWLLQFTADLEQPRWHGFVIVFLMFFAGELQSIFSTNGFGRELTAGLKMRCGLIAIIYRKALALSNSVRKERTVGEIVNLMSTDAERVRELLTWSDLFWSCPFKIIVAVYYIYNELGVATFAGVAILIVMLPLNGWMANYIKKRQTLQMKLKDERVKNMSEILNGIKVIKLYAWEESFMNLVLKIRKKEVRQLVLIAYFNAASIFLWTCTPFMVAVVSFGVFVSIDRDNVLNAEKAFVSLTCFNMLRIPLILLPIMFNYLIFTIVSVKRLNKYLNADELDNYVERSSTGPALSITNAVFSWGSALESEGEDKKIDGNGWKKKEKEKVKKVKKYSTKLQELTITLKNINATVAKGSFTAIVGNVGSGKSSLMSAILGEMEKIKGSVVIGGGVQSIAYVPQQAWIQNVSLKDNILFGCSFDRKQYQQTIEVCELKQDLDILPAGDETEIGEKGINLSGGQKQRVSLARACYSNSDLYLMDDPLSAVDAHVAQNLFDKVLSSKTGILRRKTRVLVTNNLSVLPFVDQILVMKNGSITETGSYNQLMDNNGVFSEYIKNFSDRRECEIKREMDDGRSTLVQRTRSMRQESFVDEDLRSGSLSVTEDEGGKKLIEEEFAETGRVKGYVYMRYLKSMSLYWLVGVIVGSIGNYTAVAGGNYWLSIWSGDSSNIASEYEITGKSINTTIFSADDQRTLRLSVYAIFGVIQGFAVLCGTVSLARGCVQASVKLHRDLLYRILRSPMTFFDTTPIGRIVNRFARDVDVVDAWIPNAMRNMINQGLQLITTMIMIAFITPYFLIVLIPVSILFYFIQRFYVPTARQVKRLESITRSPIYSHFAETLSGVSTIRAYGANDRFKLECDKRADLYLSCWNCSIGADRWLAIRLEFVGNIIVMFSALSAVMARETIDPGLIGLSLSYAMNVTMTLTWLVRSTSEVETNIVSIERILEYTGNEMEAEWTQDKMRMSEAWPQTGNIEFKNYGARYRPGMDLVIRDINISILPQEKIGVVGRTGAGKSTITLSLFRIIEAAAGEIIIDGINISVIGLHDLRKKLTIIPQDPVLFSGTLRFNLDPFSEKSDDQLWTCLEHAHLKDFVRSLDQGLDSKVSEGGDNMSVGQRQLVCLARALLRKTKILILDEATAAVDLETDSLIQSTIRSEFADCTIITIAHRLHTIMDSNRVLVLDQGKVVEFESPTVLLENKSSVFHSLAKNAGIVL